MCTLPGFLHVPPSTLMPTLYHSPYLTLTSKCLRPRPPTHNPHTTSSSRETQLTHTAQTYPAVLSLFHGIFFFFFLLELYPFLKCTFNIAYLKDSLHTSYTWVATNPSWNTASTQALGKCNEGANSVLKTSWESPKLTRTCHVGALEGQRAVLKTSVD